MERNFKDIKNTLADLLYISKINKDKELYKTYKQAINEIRNNPILRDMFDVYTTLDVTSFKNKEEVNLFLKECLSKFNNYSKNQIISNLNSISLLLENYNKKDCEDKLLSIILESTRDRKINYIPTRNRLIDELSEEVLNESEESTVVDDNESLEDIIEKLKNLNEEYIFLNDKEKRLLEAFVFRDEKIKEELFNEISLDALKFIKKSIFENKDNEDVLSLLKESEAKIKNMKYNSNLTIMEFSELMDLVK